MNEHVHSQPGEFHPWGYKKALTAMCRHSPSTVHRDLVLCAISSTSKNLLCAVTPESPVDSFSKDGGSLTPYSQQQESLEKYTIIHSCNHNLSNSN